MAVLIFLIVLDLVFIVWVMYFALTSENKQASHHVTQTPTQDKVESQATAPAQEQSE